MIDHQLTEWLYYEHIYRWALDKTAYDDPKYVKMLPEKEKFLDYIMECDTWEFISTLVYLFREKHPVNSSSIIAELSWDDQKETCITGKCFRKAGDIKSIYFKENRNDYILKVRLEFASLQPDAKDWVKQGLLGKTYQEQNASGETVFSFQDEILQSIKVTDKGLLIQLNPDQLPE
ncbi:hypothetical protein [uncultured Chryseobacterium sp.]|uniref:hypothetical protein n=1 Tax=uncultured Chryseobacterium sp. TaxID=259322 RepID=UPI0025F251E0|nr:hypothetical protein [uncultured Chryseobacterium sp.]